MQRFLRGSLLVTLVVATAGLNMGGCPLGNILAALLGGGTPGPGTGQQQPDEAPQPAVNLPPLIGDLLVRAQLPSGKDYSGQARDPDNGNGLTAPMNAYEQRPVLMQIIATDPEGGPLAYLWEQISGKAAAMTGVTSDVVIVTLPALDGTAPGQDTAANATLVFRLTITDSEGDTTTQDVTVRVRLLGDVNRDDVVEGAPPPTAADFAAVQAAVFAGSGNRERFDLDGNELVEPADTTVVNVNTGRSLLP